MNLLSKSVICVSLFVAIACGDKGISNTEKQDSPSNPINPKDTVNPFICPMRCENSGSSQKGKCTMCGMDLDVNPDYAKPASIGVSESN
jgi:hypothetical protein